MESAEGGLDIFAGGDVVGDVVDEGSDGDTTGVSLSGYCAGGCQVSVSMFLFWYGDGMARRGSQDDAYFFAHLPEGLSAIVKGLESRQTGSVQNIQDRRSRRESERI